MSKHKIMKLLNVIFISLFFLTSCKALKPKWVDTRKVPVNAKERALKNVEEGKGVSLGGITRGSTQYEFSTSCLLYTSPSPRDRNVSRMPSSA